MPPVLLQGVFVHAPYRQCAATHQAGTTRAIASVAPYALMVANGTVWLTYGILIGAPTVALPNITAVSLGMYYTYTFHRHKPEDAPFAPYVIAASSVAALAVGTALALEPDAAAHTVGLIGCGVLPAMFAGPRGGEESRRDEERGGHPAGLYLFSTVNTITWIGYGLLVIDDVYIWGPNVIGLLRRLRSSGSWRGTGASSRRGDGVLVTSCRRHAIAGTRLEHAQLIRICTYRHGSASSALTTP